MLLFIKAIIIVVGIACIIYATAKRWKEIDDEDEFYDRDKGGGGDFRR